MRRYINLTIIYAILAMAGGVFYREFTKFMGYNARTTLGIVHTHYFLLGVVFFIILLLLEKNFSFTDVKVKRTLIVYHVGLNLTATMFVVRGILQVLGTELSTGINSMISGIAGVGHVILGVSLVLLLVFIRRSVITSKE